MTPRAFARTLLDWYDRQGRALPWRETKDPYRIWLSEIMLQQTTVAAVIPYYRAFLQRWPAVGDLAVAALDDVLVLWQGLGYYARARNMHRCAGVIHHQHGGRFPSDEADLRSLPGIGDYTAAAIAAIAFDQPAVVIDGNIARVLARLHALTEPLPKLKANLGPLAARLTPRKRPGDYAQAMMDLGATVCRPRRPDCPGCPVRRFCHADRQGVAETLPVRPPRRAKPQRFGAAFWLSDPAGKIYLRRRPAKGLLGGMMGFPTSEWSETPLPARKVFPQAPLPLTWSPEPGRVRHGFTHFDLELSVFRGICSADQAADLSVTGQWIGPDDFADWALPTLMRKVIGLVMEQTGE